MPDTDEYSPHAFFKVRVAQLTCLQPTQQPLSPLPPPRCTKRCSPFASPPSCAISRFMQP